MQDQTLLQLTLSRPRDAAAEVKKITVRPILIRQQPQFQWTSRRGAIEHHENLAATASAERLRTLFPTAFADLHACTVQQDWVGRWKGNAVRWKQSAPSRTIAAPAEHNRQKSYLLPMGTPHPFLVEMGVMTSAGTVRPTMSAKFRQINRYLEFLEDIYESLPATGPIRVVDFGCGKSYLTFALHYWLTELHQREVSIVGRDLKADVLEQIQAAATRLKLTGLRFEAGPINQFQPSDDVPAGEPPVHLAVSLHACNTATDDGLAAALRWECPVILAVPCCHQELFRSLPNTVLPGMLGYGLLRERFAAMATDALRARYLDAVGYRTQVVEFIDLEHTPKNVLIRAVRRGHSPDAEVELVLSRYRELKASLGIKTWHLEQVGKLPLELAGN